MSRRRVPGRRGVRRHEQAPFGHTVANMDKNSTISASAPGLDEVPRDPAATPGGPVEPSPLWLLSAVPFLILAACASAPSAQTFEEARQVVLDQVVQPESLDHPVIVFALPDPLRSGDQIGPYNKEGYGPAVVPTTIEDDSWFFWIDDAPGARFCHPGRFVLISQATGEVTVAEHAWWPVLNGQGLWTEGDEYWDEGNWAFSNLASGPQGSSPPADGRARIGLAAPSAQSAGPGAALVINGWESGESGEADFETDADGMHDILTDAGFDVTYLGPKEDANPDRDGEATSSNRLDWLHEKSEELQPGDTLVIYVTAHGGVTEDGTGGIGNVFEDLLLKDLQKFDPGVHIIVILDSCYSGSFADDHSPGGRRDRHVDQRHRPVVRRHRPPLLRGLVRR